jgi:hypothetical protein
MRGARLHYPASMPARLLLLLLALSALSVPSALAQTVIYRCTDASGAVTMQNDKPCGPGMQQQIRRVGALPTAPAPAPKPAAERPRNVPPPGASFELVVGPQTDTPLPDSSVAEAERKPPPPLFQCKTWDEEIYTSENGEPEPRCAPLQTVGLNGQPGFGAGQACEMRADTCSAIEGDALCKAWRQQFDEAVFRAKYSDGRDQATRDAERDRIGKLLADSDCNTGPSAQKP